MHLGKTLLRFTHLLLAVLICSAALAVPVATQPATVPTTLPTTRNVEVPEAPLPPGAIRRLGESRFSPLESADFSAIDFSPDGSQVITAGFQPRIWEIASGRMLQHLHSIALRADHAVFLNADEVAASWQLVNQIRLTVYNAHTGQPIRDLDCDETAPLTDLQASPDGTRLAVVGRHVSLLDVKSGHRLAILCELESHQFIKKVYSPHVQFTSDSKTMMVLNADNEANFFDPVTGAVIDRLGFSTRHGASLSGDGKTIAVLNDGTFAFDVASREQLKLPNPRQRDIDARHTNATGSNFIWSTMTSNGLLGVAMNGPSPRLFLYDTNVRPIAPPRCLVTHIGYAMGLAFSRDVKTAAVIERGSRPEFIDIASGETIGTLATHKGDVTSIDVSADGRVAVSNDGMSSTALWDLSSGQRLAYADGASSDYFCATPGAVRFSADGKTIQMGEVHDTFEICDSRTLKIIRRQGWPHVDYTPPAETGRIVISPDAKIIARWGPGMNVYLHDAQKGTLMQQLEVHNPQITMIEFSPDSQTLAVAVEGGINLYPVTGGPAVIKRREGLHNKIPLSRPRFSPDGGQLALVDVAGLTLWDAVGGTADKPDRPTAMIDTFGSGEGEYDDSGALLAVSDFAPGAVTAHDVMKPAVSIFEPQTNELVVRLTDMPAIPEAIRFVPHHPWLLTGGADANVTQWDLLSCLADPHLANASTDELWIQLGDANPAAGYHAGVELMRRKALVAGAAALKRIATSNSPGDIRRWISELSDPSHKNRELAHKHLESAGAAAAPAVRNALAEHPGGELEERLQDIAGIIGVDNLNPPITATDAERLRALRLVRLLRWSDDPAAEAAAERLSGTAPTTQPTTRPTKQITTQPLTPRP